MLVQVDLQIYSAHINYSLGLLFFTDIILEPDNDGEDTCPQKVPAEYKTGTDKESPTAPKPLPRKMNDGDIKSDVDVKNIKHGNNMTC